ncbi:MAG: GDYXXLXY domain-containing protein [Opitutaceae bacterium]|nr:GDYXXLXY domain-containing protein [Opitutaceae bacterium]
MKVRLVIAASAVALQVLALGFMAGQREVVLHTGQRIWLRTAPVDPRDKMRGDYVRLRYDISEVPRELWRGGLEARFAARTEVYSRHRNHRDLPVYATLRNGEAGVAELVSLSDERPAGGLFLAGRVNYLDGDLLLVRYGVEAMFTEQGKAQRIEDARLQERPGNPLNTEVAVNAAGLAVLRGYRWEPLGLAATFERVTMPAETNPDGAPRRAGRQFIRRVKLELKNHGPEDVAVVDLSGGGSWRLVPNERLRAGAHYRWSGVGETAAKPTAADVILLKPGEVRTMFVDLMEPRWFVADTRKPDSPPIPLRDAQEGWFGSFRLEYAPPAKADVAGLPHADLIRHGRLVTRAFNATVTMD